MKKIFTLLLFLLVCSIVSNAQTKENKDDKPVMTIGCLSDLHNELGLISGDVSNVKLRGTIVNTLKRMHDEEDVDLICLGGDYTSDVTISKENWERVKQLIHEASRSAFHDNRSNRPVIYVTGNHDYEVANFDNLPKSYNAGYYEDIMTKDIGPLSNDDAYYETSVSLNGQKLLGAFHYQINGFDFVTLNCGLYFYQNAWNYTYSSGSVQWVVDKLDKIYASDPNKTVFFLVHVPFSDSNSISSTNKGMKNDESMRLLKSSLAQYPNLIMLYGHDHGTNSAFIRTNTSQRVTRYDTDGVVISSFDDTHVDEPASGSALVKVPALISETTSEPTPVKVKIKSLLNGKYLTYDVSTNLSVQDEAMEATITKKADSDNLFTVMLGGSYVYCGSKTTFSGNLEVTDYSSACIYKVNNAKATRVTSVDALVNGAKIVIVCKSSNDKKYYALLPENTMTTLNGDNRMKSQLFADGNLADEISVENNIVWQLEQDVEEVSTLPLDACIKNVATGKYIGADANNLNTIDEANTCNIYEDNGSIFVKMPNNDRDLHIGTGGRFSRGTATALMFFDMKAVEGTNNYVGTLVQNPKLGGTYAIAGKKDGKNYVLTNNVFNAGQGDDQRLDGYEVTVTDNTITLSDNNFFWTLTEKPEKPTLPMNALIQNVATGKYIGEDANNLNTIDEANTCNIYEEEGAIYVKMLNNNRHLHIGTNGRFSRGDATALKFFEMKAVEGTNNYVGTLVQNPKLGGTYAIAGEKDGKNYVLTNNVFNAGQGDNQRLDGYEVTVTDNTITLSDNNFFWTLKEREPGKPSFVSSFMGSMRYYNNSIEGDVTVNNSKIVQALMIYIYPDRITLKMKNYGESGTFGNITINKDLAAYTIYREVRNSNGLVTGIKDINNANKTKKNDGRIYDLMGRQVKKPTHGVYIVNGRKVVF